MLLHTIRLQTSTSFMTGTGLKKWRPPNLSFLLVTLAISVMGREEVLLANTVVLHIERTKREQVASEKRWKTRLAEVRAPQQTGQLAL